MATWRDRMRPATFRGVPFHVDASEFSGGRRTVTHKYPLRSLPYVEDLGRESRAFAIEGYVVGTDYLEKRDALISALEQEGPGELVHPYYGTRRVALTGPVRVRETREDGGTAIFALEFTETEEAPRFPTAAPAGPAALAASAAKARSKIGAAFLARYNPKAWMTAPTRLVEGVIAIVKDAQVAVRMTTDAAAEFRSRLARLEAEASTLVQRPNELLAEVQGIVAIFDSLRGLDVAYDLDPGERPPSTTPSRVDEQAAYDELLNLIRALIAAREAEVAPSQPFDTYDAAVLARDAILAKLDDQGAATGDDGVYAALLQLRADLVRAVPGGDQDLPRLARYAPPATVPSVVLAHRLYGDLAREDDIVTRNRVPRPGFILGGIELEVLSAAAG